MYLFFAEELVFSFNAMPRRQTSVFPPRAVDDKYSIDGIDGRAVDIRRMEGKENALQTDERSDIFVLVLVFATKRNEEGMDVD